MRALGKVAKCQKGAIGLVLRITRIPGREKPLYGGICLDPGRVGQTWQSINPEWIGTFDDWVRLRYAEIVESEQTATMADIAKFDTPTKRNLLT